MKDIITQNKQ